MNDVVAAALIASGFTALVAITGNVTTYVVSKRQALTSIATVEHQAATDVATVERQAEVELEKVKAEAERLRQEFREAERRNRQGTYHRLLAVLDRMDMFATGYPPDDATFDETTAEFNFVHGGVLLFGADRVTEAMTGVTNALSYVGSMMADKEGSKAERWRAAYLEHRRQVVEAQGALIAVGVTT